MAKLDWQSVTREDVIKAVELFLSENPEYPSPRNTFLMYEGERLPAKHIRGMAYKVAHNQELSKNDYTGGMDTVRFFEKLGFEMLYTGETEETQKANAHENKKKPNIANAQTKDKPKTECKNILIPKAEQNIDEEHCIKIPSKAVIEQKNALQLLLNKMFDGDIVCEKTYDWLKTPSEIKDEYIPLVKALTAYRGDKSFAKTNYQLKCDFVCESKKLIIEYDERQHFSEARKISLEAYRGIPLCYDRELWIKACNNIQAKDNQPADRDEGRAFYDSTRDIEAAKHGYTLVRIMHGQIDFEKEGASAALKKLLTQKKELYATELSGIKIAMYLQFKYKKGNNQKKFDPAMEVIKKSDADILVFPEDGWYPFVKLLKKSDVFIEDDINTVYDKCLDFSKELGRAVIISSIDKNNTIFSVYANAQAAKGETKHALYIKHTMTEYSAFENEKYKDIASQLFAPIVFRDHKIGMTICYDCNHSLFSRMYGLQGVDIIINSTGGNVVDDKWYKYNQTRAIENQCYTFVTMGGLLRKNSGRSYVYGFNPSGKRLKPHLLNEKELHPNLSYANSDKTNMPGGIYIYDTASEPIEEDVEKKKKESKKKESKKKEKEKKNQEFFIPDGDIESILQKSKKLEDNLYVLKFKTYNIVFCVADGKNIFSAESILPLMYSEKLKTIENKRYIIVCRYKNLTKKLYENKLSVVLRVRAMENYCAVILESDFVNHCYQTGMCRTSQVVEANNGKYGLDLLRMTGPEAIWKNKDSFKASWRTNFEWLARECEYIAKNHKWSKE